MTSARQQIRFCTTADGVRLAYATSGKGPPLLRVGSFINHLDFDWDSPVWRHWLRELSRDHTLVRYDARACGLSDREVPDISFDAWVNDLEAVADAAGLERFALLGASQGAPIAIAYAVRHPERVSHLVLYGGYTRGRLRWSDSALAREEALTMPRLAELGWGKDNAAFRQFFTTQFIPGGTPEQHAWFNELERVSVSPANAARFMNVTNDLDVSDLAPRVACPTLVLHSKRDARVPFDEGRLMAAGDGRIGIPELLVSGNTARRRGHGGPWGCAWRSRRWVRHRALRGRACDGDHALFLSTRQSRNA